MAIFLAGMANAARVAASQLAKKAGTSAATKAAGRATGRGRRTGGDDNPLAKAAKLGAKAAGIPSRADLEQHKKKIGPVLLVLLLLGVLACFAGSALVGTFGGVSAVLGGAASGAADSGGGGAGCDGTDVVSVADSAAESFDLPAPADGGPFSQGGPGAKPGAVPATDGGDFPHVDQLSVMKAAGKHYGVPWYLLAAISWQETKHGTDPNTWRELSSEGDGALGNMRFTPGTWADYGVDTDGHKATAADRHDWADQLWSAANMLSTWDGVPGFRDGNDVRTAIHRYNWHDWYVNDILWWAEQYADGSTTISGGGSCGLAVASGAVGAVIQYALDQRGKPYVMGGTGPDVFDCSGLMLRAWQQIGINITRTASTQADAPNVRIVQRRPIDVAALQPGDLLFYDAKPGDSYRGSYSTRLGTDISHVIMYMGNHQVVEATPPRVISSTYTDQRFQGFVAVGRVTGVPAS
jgi:hypothetical protein